VGSVKNAKKEKKQRGAAGKKQVKYFQAH